MEVCYKHMRHKRFWRTFGIPNETINLQKLNREIAKGKKKYYMSQLFNFSFIKAKMGMVKLKLYFKFANCQLGKNKIGRSHV